MARSDDNSPGDARKPYSNQGGPAGRHAETHDVRTEELTDPKGPAPVDPTFAEQIEPLDLGLGEPGGFKEQTLPAAADKTVVDELPKLNGEELDRLSLIAPGSRLEQGSIYLDLNHLNNGPFKALGGHVVSDGDRYVAKHDTDYLLWNRLVGRNPEVDIERPAETHD